MDEFKIPDDKIKEVLKALRDTRPEWTQEKFGARLGRGLSTIQRWESGKEKEPGQYPEKVGLEVLVLAVDAAIETGQTDIANILTEAVIERLGPQAEHIFRYAIRSSDKARQRRLTSLEKRVANFPRLPGNRKLSDEWLNFTESMTNILERGDPSQIDALRAFLKTVNR